MEFYGDTDIGLERRNNEDAWAVDEALSTAVVADGMGGAACGEIASAVTIESFLDYLRHPAEELPPEALAREAVREANRRVIERAQGETNCEGMGSTIVAAVWQPPRVTIVNVGDSRAYLFRSDILTQLSYDQTLANELRHALRLSEDEISAYTGRNVLTMAIGARQDLLIQTHEAMLEPGDRLLLCSDGLYGMAPDAAIAAMLSAGWPLRDTVERLIGLAKAGGGEDNITVVLLAWNP